MPTIMKKGSPTTKPTGEATVNLTHVSGEKVSTTKVEESLQVPAPNATGGNGPYAMVGVELGRVWTDNNYGSYRANVSLVMPSDPTDHDVELTYEAALLFVDGKLNQLIGDN